MLLSMYYAGLTAGIVKICIGSGASEAEEEPRTDDLHPSDDEDAVEGEDLLARLQRIMAKKGYLCEPEVPTKVKLKKIKASIIGCINYLMTR